MAAKPRLAPLLTVLLLLPLAGCLDADNVPSPDDLMNHTPTLEDALAALEAGKPRANVARLAEYDAVGGGQELDAWENYLAVMQNPKLLIVDVTDPSNPQVASELQMTAVLDVKWSDDGKYIFVGNDDGEGSVPGVTDSQRPGGFYVVDATDKTAPEVVHFLPIGPRRGPHMVTYHRMPDGSEILVGANGDVSIAKFDRTNVVLTEVARYQVDLATGVDRSPELFDVLYGVPGWAHDAHIQTEPDGTVLMYVAHWDAGLRIVDITDPANPTEVGAWMEFPEGHSGNLHTVTTDWIGDKRITVGTPELGFSVVGGFHYAQGDELTGVYIWDTTDPAHIELVNFWSHPKDECRYAGRDLPQGGEEITSTHNLQFERGRAYVAHYACGVLVLDLSTPELWKAPTLLAYDMGDDLVDTWDIILKDGVIYLGEATYVVAANFALDPIGPGGITSRA